MKTGDDVLNEIVFTLSCANGQTINVTPENVIPRKIVRHIRSGSSGSDETDDGLGLYARPTNREFSSLVVFQVGLRRVEC